MTRSLTIVAVLLAASLASAQSVVLPLPRLLTTKPMGGQIGTTVEIVISGEHLEDVTELLFDHPGLTAMPATDAAGQLKPNTFSVVIAADCPSGLYEARVLSRLGVSSPRVFSVGALTEVSQGTSNTDLNSAMSVPVNSVCNAVMTARSADFYAFGAVQGHRYVVHCDARGIDSKLDAVLIVADSAGRDLLVERRGGTLDFTAPADGRYVIKVHELTFKGGSEYFYRLTLRELVTDELIPEFAATRAVNTFSWPPANLPSSAALVETEPNAAATPQVITLPCDISGAFATAADTDTFEFSGTKGDVWWIEVGSERLGRPTDPSIIVQRVIGEGDQQTLADIVEFTDIPSPVKVSSNGYAYDGPAYNGGSGDIIGQLSIPEDGRYRLQMTDLYGGTRNDPRNNWRLVIRKATPDFAIVAWGLHMELRNGDRNAVSKPLALRGGGTIALEVAAVRRDGFDGPIELRMDGLPDGVTAAGLTIPAGKSRGIVLVSADQNAPRGWANVSFTGRAAINGAEVIHDCPIAMHAWPIVDSWSEIPFPRLTETIPVSVSGSEYAPVTVATAEKKVWEVKSGEKLTLPLMLTRRSEFSGSVMSLRTFGEGFESHPAFDVSLTSDTAETTLDLATLKPAPGDYTIAFYGNPVARYRYNPDAVAAAEAVHKAAADTLQAADAELQQLITVAASAPVEAKSAADLAVTEATTRKQAAEAALTAAAAVLKSATDQATPRDTVDIVISEPITVRVLNP